MIARSVLLIGAPSSGKTTLLAQLHSRMRSRTGAVRERRAPADLAPVREGQERLSRGLAVTHTPTTSAVERQHLHGIGIGGDQIDLVVPDYAGERQTAAVTERELAGEWRDDVVRAGEWVLLLRLSQHPKVPNVLDHPQAELPGAPAAGAGPSPGPVTPLHADLMHVELLQIFAHELHSGARGSRRAPRLTLALSCWDELGAGDSRPEEVAAAGMPLLHAYVAANWVGPSLRFLGVSAQGRRLDDAVPDYGFVDSGPQKEGYIVLPDGTTDKDLTLLLAR